MELGLRYIKNEMFMLFCSIEKVLQLFLKVSAVRELSAETKGAIVNGIGPCLPTPISPTPVSPTLD